MELPKRARTADWENGVLTLDGEKKFDIPELTTEIMEQLAGYTLVGFHVKSYPVTDELLAPFAGHKSMANFGVEDGALTDACFPVFSAMPKLRYLLLDGNAAIHGSSLSALQGCKLDLLTLNRTGLDDAGLLQAASIPKLSHIQIDHTAVTYEGLLAIAGNNRIEPVAHVQFTQEQMEHFFQLQREKAKKPVQLDEQAAAECRRVLSAFFAEMTQWEQYMEQAGFEGAEAVPRLLTIWEKYVSEKPRPGYRPLGLSYSAQGTYNGEEFLDAEQITKNKLYIYTREKNTGFDRRFLMKRVGEGWKIDAVQERAAHGSVRHHMAWEYETFGPDGQCKLFGVNIFDYDWQTTGKRVKIKDPIYHQDHTFEVWQVEIDGQIHRFAAGEFSNCVWGFYLEKDG